MIHMGGQKFRGQKVGTWNPHSWNGQVGLPSLPSGLLRSLPITSPLVSFGGAGLDCLLLKERPLGGISGFSAFSTIRKFSSSSFSTVNMRWRVNKLNCSSFATGTSGNDSRRQSCFPKVVGRWLKDRRCCDLLRTFFKCATTKAEKLSLCLSTIAQRM